MQAMSIIGKTHLLNNSFQTGRCDKTKKYERNSFDMNIIDLIKYLLEPESNKNFTGFGALEHHLQNILI